VSNFFTSLSEKLRFLLPEFPANPQGQNLPSPGLYHFTHQTNNEQSRIHLRIDADGSGVLMVNANRILHLNTTAAHMAYLVLARTPKHQAVRTIQQVYRVGHSQADQDYAQINAQLEELIRHDGSCPIHEIGLDVIAPFSKTPSAPYRIDLALTYRCNNDCAHCYNARDRRFPELTTQQWFHVLDKIWEIGIPHIVFTVESQHYEMIYLSLSRTPNKTARSQA